MAYRDAITFVCVTTKNPAMFQRFLPAALSGNQLIAVVDAFYSQPQNIDVPLEYVLQLVAAKASGVGVAEIEARIQAIRNASRQMSPK